MSNNEYLEVIEEIENFYEKDYSDIQNKEIYNRFKTMKIERFRYIVSKLYETNIYLFKLLHL